MKQLYRGGEISPPLHEIDVPDWLSLGWFATPEEAALSSLAQKGELIEPAPTEQSKKARAEKAKAGEG